MITKLLHLLTPSTDTNNAPAKHPEVLHIIDKNTSLIEHTVRSFGFFRNDNPEINEQTLFHDVIENFCEYCLGVPASEGYHHAQKYGLINHSIQVANRSLRKAKDQYLPAKFSNDIESLRRKPYQYAAWLCGLLHDAGKIHTDMLIHDKADANNIWMPTKESMVSWIERTNVIEYQVEWRKDRLNKKHDSVAIIYLNNILTPAAHDFLNTCPKEDDIIAEIADVLSGYTRKEGYLYNAVRHADSLSTAQDLQTIWDEKLGPRKAALHEKIIKCMRELADKWILEGSLLSIDDEIYLRWPDCFNQIAEKLRVYDKGVPHKAASIKKTMFDRGMVRGLIDDEYALFFQDLTERDKALEKLSTGQTGSGKGLLRLEYGFLALDAKPHPKNVFGLLKMNMAGESLLITEKDVEFLSLEQIELAKPPSSGAENKTESKAINHEQEPPTKANKQNTKPKPPSKEVTNESTQTKRVNPKKVKPKQSNSNPLLNGQIVKNTDSKEPQKNAPPAKEAQPEKEKPVWYNSKSPSTHALKVIPELLSKAKTITIDNALFFLIDDVYEQIIKEKIEVNLVTNGYLITRSPLPHAKYFIHNNLKYIKANQAICDAVCSQVKVDNEAISTPPEKSQKNNKSQKNSKRPNAESLDNSDITKTFSLRLIDKGYDEDDITELEAEFKSKVAQLGVGSTDTSYDIPFPQARKETSKKLLNALEVFLVKVGSEFLIRIPKK